ncbi:signal recognition particle subunit SRP14, putative [Plasmodium berghei]|uniref:Signal recognition particle 14 kDa protein n=2 Tax=Plasmodium berghei TaxID=5821 RepID=A0A509AGT1_PLABA|nr:signal recognition particle subunit SRP14, putative [Plasmodium berghei ANKA]CXI15288.1 signal recognition particle subunit SRP14, putative [Plasmodium berghei]SCM19552.1 signal recognition particle subunit SRP14, putative [Plasmodium berghei]SCN23302.1 signal recognition particle subunit SRP14, putative [Plasmodium berghei]SCO59011.1 signal recognition particle subunit SRP14, putative [Plasmodium berghei]SCO59537.1 signal recognition particle subunit SRP14, putative [Plasmodium berghei]|eukprot:XP_034420522.1 signal recognition particle subunit SRP14, putative [Plasmodium berghei ANKA]
MVLLNNSKFIEELTKLCNKNEEHNRASIWITIKKVKRSDIKMRIPKNEISDKRNKKNHKDENKNNKNYFCIIRATDGKKIKLSTHVSDDIINFSQEINNIIKK